MNLILDNFWNVGILYNFVICALAVLGATGISLEVVLYLFLKRGESNG